jgi:hypothetical protein
LTMDALLSRAWFLGIIFCECQVAQVNPNQPKLGIVDTKHKERLSLASIRKGYSS